MSYNWLHSGLNELMATGLEGKTLEAILVTTGDTLDQVNDQFVSDIVANEISGGNYVRIVLTNAVMIESQNSRATVFDADDIVFPNITGHTVIAGYIAIRHADGDAYSKLLTRFDDTDVVTNGGNYEVTGDANDGFGYLTAA